MIWCRIYIPQCHLRASILVIWIRRRYTEIIFSVTGLLIDLKNPKIQTDLPFFSPLICSKSEWFFVMIEKSGKTNQKCFELEQLFLCSFNKVWYDCLVVFQRIMIGLNSQSDYLNFRFEKCYVLIYYVVFLLAWKLTWRKFLVILGYWFLTGTLLKSQDMKW